MVNQSHWRDPQNRQTFFLGLTAVWTVATSVAVAAATIWHFAEVGASCDRMIAARSAEVSSDLVIDGASVIIACQGPTTRVEVPMNAAAAGFIVSVLGLVLAVIFLIMYSLSRRRST